MNRRFRRYSWVVLSFLISLSVIGKDNVNTKTIFAKRGENLFVLGNFDTLTFKKMVKLIEGAPGITRIVFTANGGSEDDESTLELARYIRDKGIDTHVMDGGVIASGGVSLFLAGKRRSIGKNVFIGVHAWQHCSGDLFANCKSATEYNRSDTEHNLHKNYIVDMLHDEQFYWFSINSAEHDSIHWLTKQEILHYGIQNYTLDVQLELPFREAFREEHRRVCHNCVENEH